MAGEVITSPAPIVGYDPPWEKPQLYEHDPRVIMNAFALGVHSNLMRQQIQGKLAQLALANEKLQFQMERSQEDFDLKYRGQDLRNQWELALQGHRGDMLELEKQKLDNTIEHQGQMYDLATLKQAKDAEYTQAAGSLTGDLGENPHPPGTAEASAWAEDKMRDYADWSDSKNIQSIKNAERRRQRSAALDLHRDAKDALDFYQRDFNMTTSSKGITKYQWNQPDDMWGIDRKKGTRWVAYSKDTGAIIDPSLAAGKGDEELDKAGIRRSEIESHHYDRLRNEEAGLKKYSVGGRLAPAPVDTTPDQNGTVRVRNAQGQGGRIPVANLQDALKNGYTIDQ